MKTVRQMTISQLDAAFPDEDACKAYLAARRWPNGVHCPRCGNVEVYALKSKPFHWQCQACSPTGYRFSVLVGTIFENTNYPLKTWFRVIHMMLTSKKGISALQVHRTIGTGSYRTAWSMCHRIRAGMQDDTFRRLMGVVEIDETYIGGDEGNRPHGKRGKGEKKSIVAGAVRRGGKVIARVIDAADSKTLGRFVYETVHTKVSLLASDDHGAYKHLKGHWPHKIVRHSRGEYVVGAVHTNTIEGFWSILKRGVVGTYHKVSKKYLPLYVAEFSFRYNNRKNADIFGTAIAGF